MSGQDRLYLGQGHERRVGLSLEARGWHVHPWGQGILSAEVRSAFYELDRDKDVLLWRWLPDMIAVKGDRILLVEAKAEHERNADTPHFSIELRCVMAQLAMKPLGLPSVIVWANGYCNYTENLRVIDYRMPSGTGRRVRDANGSGTAFALVRKDEQLPMDDIFGPRIDQESEAA